MSLLFTPFEMKTGRGPLTLPNRIVIAPMCQYSAREGVPGDWHLAHWTNLLNSGAGMMTIEATAISPESRITPYCLGLWDARTRDGLGSVLHRARLIAPAMPVCIQLSHAGRKASSAAPWEGGGLLGPADGGWTPLAPSAIPQQAAEPSPQVLSRDQIDEIRAGFVRAAHYARETGVDAIELHAAHGYLLHQFLSPLSNQRDDDYGGSADHRMRLTLEVFRDVLAAFGGAVGVRISATDWVEGGWDLPQTLTLAARLRELGCTFIHVSTAGVSPQQKIPVGPGYQVPFAREVRRATGLPTTAVGLITEARQAEDILQAGDADLVAIARALLFRPRWPWEAAAQLQGQVQSSPQYWRCLPRDAAGVFGSVRIGQR